MDNQADIVITPGDDATRAYTHEEQEQLAQNLVRLLDEIHRGLLPSDLNLQFLCELHGKLFAGVRGHAGRTRRRDYGSERLQFGRCRSIHRDQVETELKRMFTEFRKSFDSLRANPDHEQYEEYAIHVAAWVHAKLVHVHPFEDGNGRTSRAFMNAVLVALGLRPIPIEAVRVEYIDCLDAFYFKNDIEPLKDLLMRMYPG